MRVDSMKALKLLILLLLIAGAAAALFLPGREGVMGSFVTSLQGRTKGQRINAERAAKALDGATIAPGHTFSFNKTVGPWTPDRGYVLAPVSYDGELIVDWGGGVCQTSTALYNAALVAGLEVVERHRHNWAPGYVPPGRDAAVAQYTIDLRLRNPFPHLVRLRAVIRGESIGFEIVGRQAGPLAAVECAPSATVEPVAVVKYDASLAPGQRRLITHGRTGMRVDVYRTFLRGKRMGERELVSHDTYPAMNQIIAVGAR
jgi:vancomycin resistance protein YoaR